MGEAAAASAAMLRQVEGLDADLARSEDDKDAPQPKQNGSSSMGRLAVNGSPSGIGVLLAGILTSGGVGAGAGALIGNSDGPTQADLDQIRRDVGEIEADVEGVTEAQTAVTAAQAASHIELLEKQNAQLSYNTGQGFWFGANMLKISGAVAAIARELELDLDVEITPLTRDGR